MESAPGQLIDGLPQGDVLAVGKRQGNGIDVLFNSYTEPHW
jgi:hypothetical protein